MEVSYYIECQSNSEEYYDPTCLTADKRSAEFLFKIDANYQDTNINKSNELWTRVEPLLKKSFGRIEIILSKEQIQTFPVRKRRRNGRSSTQIEKQSVRIQAGMHPVRNSAKDLEQLLADDKTACLKFLSFNSIAKSGDSCWNENTKSIFKEKEIEFLGVDMLRLENNPSNDKFASPIKSTTKNEATKTSTITTLTITSTKTISTIFSTTTTSTTSPLTKPSTATLLTKTILTPLLNAPMKPSITTTHQSVISKPVNGLILKETITSSTLSSSYSWCYLWCMSMNYTKCQLTIYTNFRQCEWNGG